MTVENNSEDAISLDSAFEILSHTYRRRILVVLVQHDSDIKFGIDHLIQASDRRDIELSLHHNHLPKLDQIELINWNREEDTISRGIRFEEIAPMLELLIEHREELPGRQRYSDENSG
ncbi:DUF7344 domain-containing protein [Haloplanus ruber]|uniref:ArsR family transcriptional regulator n=1 Tax=Haloplanus ruber TaxID=869892 RepID=A0ABD6D3Z5_9EURY